MTVILTCAVCGFCGEEDREGWQFHMWRKCRDWHLLPPGVIWEKT